MGLGHAFPELGSAPAVAARSVIQTPAVNASGAWDESALVLIRWNGRGNGSTLGAALPSTKFFLGKGVAIFRPATGRPGAYLGAKAGDSTVTHQDLDHGSFVWETGGYRWAIDLGSESYLLQGMFLPFAGRYSYYRKSTRGHNTISFGDSDPGSFDDPGNNANTDEAINIFSALSPGAACVSPSPARHLVCSGGEVAMLNLTSAYSNATHAPTSVIRRFELGPAPRSAADLNMAVVPAGHRLTIDDQITQRHPSARNVTWAMHTRAAVKVRPGEPAMTLSTELGARSAAHSLGGVGGQSIELSFTAEPKGACGPGWATADVVLPISEPPRFPVEGVRKIWLDCRAELTRLRVSISDL